MSHLLKSHYDKLLVAFAAAALALSSTWLWRQQGPLRHLRSEAVAVNLNGSVYEAAHPRAPEPSPVVWPTAVPQSSGPGWLYEIFTPPVIYYNALAKSFTVSPPVFVADVDPPFGLELLGVKQEQFRLQLVGYFGGPGNYLAAFKSRNQPGTILAREGRRFDQLGLTLKSFAVRKVLVARNDAGPVYDVAALAVLADADTGADLVLDSRTPKFADAPIAVIKLLAGGAGSPRELHEGDTFVDGVSTYRIERIQLSPPEVVVARQTTGLSVPETKVLHPVAGNARRQMGRNAPAAGPFPDRPADGVAITGR